ncbi:hypothetical protein [Fodinicurvata sp. EGI_FJ10296]|uniref:hypothetical protein n=1 Tax=Fodinicurvata sp. EGI_FJ10296 TaxID=3231908 RepID=UPI0034541F73
MTAIDTDITKGGITKGGITKGCPAKGHTVTGRLRRFLANGASDIRPADLFADWRPADIANILGGFDAADAARILTALPPRQRAAIIVYFDTATRSAISDHLPARLREHLATRSDRLARRQERSAARESGRGIRGQPARPRRRDGYGVSGWATNVALDAATVLLQRGHRLGVIGPSRLARGLMKVAGWRGRLRRQSASGSWAA